MIVKGQQYREKEILDYHKTDIPDDIDANRKRRKEIIQWIIKARQRNHLFKYLARHTGKGAREGIRILYKKDSENRIIETYSDREYIEQAIMEHNIQLY